MHAFGKNLSTQELLEVAEVITPASQMMSLLREKALSNEKRK